jgi:glutamine cyclotransferase
MHCKGLALKENVTDSDTCRLACCAMIGCTTWQYDQSPNSTGCFVGNLTEISQCSVGVGTNGWVGEGIGKDTKSHITVPTILANYTHDQSAFTEGLVFNTNRSSGNASISSGTLYESTGLADTTGCCSTLRKVDLESGRVAAYVNLSSDVFAEGITVWGDEVFQITYQLGIGFVYDRHTLKQIRTFKFKTSTSQGWGLTHDGSHLIMSDGSEWIYFLDPKTLEEKHRRRVFYQGQAFGYINELEWVNGELLANLWISDYYKIARINASTGTVTGFYDLSAISPLIKPDHDVFNGIAYDSSSGHLIVTGKWFNKLFVVAPE